MKTLSIIPIMTSLGILMFMAGHFWVNDSTKDASMLIAFPIFLCIAFLGCSIQLLIDNADSE